MTLTKLLRWWRRLTGAILIFLGWTLLPPHVFNSGAFEAFLFTLAGVFVIVSTIEHRDWLFIASAALAATACAARICTIVFIEDPRLDGLAIVRGSLVWVLIGGGFVFAAVSDSRLR